MLKTKIPRSTGAVAVRRSAPPADGNCAHQLANEVANHPRCLGSNEGRPLDSQLEYLPAAACASRNIYRGKVTGARASRRELNRMLAKLAPGDVVTVTRIDRLAAPSTCSAS
jgi:hypothetical protein